MWVTNGKNDEKKSRKIYLKLIRKIKCQIINSETSNSNTVGSQLNNSQFN